MRSFFSMCSALVAKNKCKRPDLAGFRASAALEMSRSLARANEQTVDSLMTSAIDLTHSKSPFELAAKPASITSTFRRSNWRAMRSFSSRVMEAPGDCSPSRKVVSKMMSLSAMKILQKNQIKKPATQNKNGPLLMQTGRWNYGERVRYRLRPLADSSSASKIRFILWNISQLALVNR